ncbi:MAG: metal ABC transporter ATP-binding protein [Parvibaculaceae bacterium]
MTAVEFDRVTLAIAGRNVLSDVSLAIGSHEFIGLLGPNGSGKTTLLRAIMGLVPAASGHVRVFGNPAARGNPAIGYMPQLRSSVDAVRLSGWDFVASVVNGHRLGLPILAREAREEVERVLDLVEARDLAERPLMEVSGGERQRLLLAQALIGRPRLLLLDEPLISLDPRRQESVVALVRRVQAALAIPVVFSSHELNPLLGAIDKVLYLGSGQAAIGTVSEVITGPVLSRLYGSPISVVRLGGRIFVLSGEHEVERDAHRHEHDHAAI